MICILNSQLAINCSLLYIDPLHLGRYVGRVFPTLGISIILFIYLFLFIYLYNFAIYIYHTIQYNTIQKQYSTIQKTKRYNLT